MVFATEQKSFGFKKEGSRGVAEAAPDKFLAVGADANIDYTQTPIPDEKVRGSKARFPSAPGPKAAAGTIPDIDVEAGTIGDLLLGCLGGVATTQPDAGGAPSVFQHVFTRSDSVQLPSYTMFLARGLHTKKYPLGTFKKLSFAGAVDGKATVSADVVAKKEEDAAGFTPSFGAPKPLMFFKTDFRIDGISDLNVRSWSLDIDNNVEGLRTLSLSQDPRDIIAKGKFIIEGGFEIYFETDAQRQNFLANQAAALEIILTGENIEAGFDNQLKLALPGVRYTAFPLGNLDDLLGAAVTYAVEQDLGLGKDIEATLINAVGSL